MKLGLFIACVAGTLAAQTALNVAVDIPETPVDDIFDPNVWGEKFEQALTADFIAIGPVVAAQEVYRHYRR